MFRQTIALNDIDEVMDCLKFPTVGRILMIVFLIIATVALLNMLIAAMNDTYTSVRDQKTELWLRIKLQMAFHIERRTFGLMNRMPRCCSYCNPKCNCKCRDEEACKIACGCRDVMDENDNENKSKPKNDPWKNYIFRILRDDTQGGKRKQSAFIKIKELVQNQ